MHSRSVCSQSQRVCVLLGGSGLQGLPAVRAVKVAALLLPPSPARMSEKRRVCCDQLAA
jgi:hypothetical protein